jgi:hypothetical protein
MGLSAQSVLMAAHATMKCVMPSLSNTCAATGTAFSVQFVPGLLCRVLWRWGPCKSQEATKREVSNLRQQNMVTSPKGLGPKNDCAGKGQQHIQKADPSSHQRGHPT